MIEVLLMRPPDTDWRVYPTVWLSVWGMLSARNGFTRQSFIKSILFITLFYFTPILFCGIGFILLALSFGFEHMKNPPVETESSEPLWDNPYKPLQGAEVIDVGKYKKQINVKGRSFLYWMEKDGLTRMQELDKHGTRMGKPIVGSPDILGKHLKWKINNNQ